MQLELIMPYKYFKDWVKDFNDLIKSKKLNYPIEIYRLGEEMS